MLDINQIRENSEFVKQRLNSRGQNFSADIEKVLEIDKKRRNYETDRQALLSQRKQISKNIGMLKAQKNTTADKEAKSLTQEVKKIIAKIEKLDSDGQNLTDAQRQLLLNLPNLPHPECPEGKDESANPIIRTWGEKPEIDNPLDHVELCERNNLVDFHSATKISGSGFAVFTGLGAKLQRSLINSLLDTQTRENGYQEISPPVIINRKAMIGTGQLPKFEPDVYEIDDGKFFLAPTAEVPLTNLYRDSILPETQLPIKLTAYTPCFRRESGSTGSQTRGLLRMHQFDKIELVKITHPEESYAELESLTQDAEKILQKLNLHYRVIELCTGDLGFGSAKTYDIEVWSPAQQSYLEVSSCSNFEGFQARRMNLRFKNQDGKNLAPHTLNGSGTAIPRLFIALIETCQDQNGKIKLPDILKNYF